MLTQLQAAHPTLVQKFSIGRSYEGRQIWAVKISDNVSRDESEPEIFIDANIHARERAAGAMALQIIHWLVDGYGIDSRMTNIVNTREIFIVPMMNPDGVEYDAAGATYRQWRKNRQPIPGSSAIGIDLNRQFGYMWACCHGSSDQPTRPTYHGPSPWFAPEVRAYRDFIASRVIGGVQQIKGIISWHSAAHLVLWPYFFTKTDVPAGAMTVDDHTALVALGQRMAALNGYKPEQGSDLYIADGTETDWAYHEYGIFAFLFEMKKGASNRYYPTPQELSADIRANRESVLLFLESADCYYRFAGLDAQYCH